MTRNLSGDTWPGRVGRRAETTGSSDGDRLRGRSGNDADDARPDDVTFVVAVEYAPTVIGRLDRAGLAAALSHAGVRLNASATSLLGSEAFDFSTGERTNPIGLSVGELGFTDGARLPQVLAAGQTRGLELWPLTAAPYLRLATLDQDPAPDSIMSSGRAPSGSVTVASPRPRQTTTRTRQASTFGSSMAHHGFGVTTARRTTFGRAPLSSCSDTPEAARRHPPWPRRPQEDRPSAISL